ncbi:MAG: riboflavin biosynthesis protein RibF [Planctomycetes bacterium]|nr:riboflavin biosynthesis protein RibF [Planctomycetota bacterium]
MRILRNLNSLPRTHLKSPVLTWGIFDGVHRGHQTLIKEVVRTAKQGRVDSLALTFQEHPKKVLQSHKDALFITSLEHRLILLERPGVSACLVLPFDRRFSRLSPESFIRLVYQKIKPSVIVVTPGITFGRDRSGDINTLKSLCKQYGIKVKTVHLLGSTCAECLSRRGTVRSISSTRIRAAIRSGRLLDAKRMLGRPVSILGTVVRGSQRGRQIGFPTANLDPHHEILPPSGVYAGRCRLDGQTYRALVNIGTRPTFTSHPALSTSEKSTNVVIEVHLLGYHKHERLYGKNIEVEIVRRLPAEIKFTSPSQLINRIKSDIKIANSLTF